MCGKYEHDFYTILAAELFEVPPCEVTGMMRAQAKELTGDNSQETIDDT